MAVLETTEPPSRPRAARRSHRPGDRLPGSTRSTTASSSRCATAMCRSRRTRSPASSARRAAASRTVLRSLNRMNDLIPSFRLEGHVQFLGQDIYAKAIDPVVVRRHIGMVFQQPNPFSMSIYENVAFGLRLNRYRGDYRRSGSSMRCAAPALWDEVKDKLKQNGLVAVGRPAAAALHRPRHRHRADGAADGRALLGARSDRDAHHRGADARAEEGLHGRDRHPQHAAGDARRRHDRVLLGRHLQGGRTGYLVEIGETAQIFDDPREKLTKHYIAASSADCGARPMNRRCRSRIRLRADGGVVIAHPGWCRRG